MPAKVTIERAAREIDAVVYRASHGKERITLTKRGKAVAVLVSIEDAAALDALEDRKLAAAALRTLRRVRKGTEPTRPWAEVKRELAAK